MKKQMHYYIFDQETNKECLSVEDLLNNTRKLIEYYSSQDQIDTINVQVSCDILQPQDFMPQLQEIDFVKLQEMPEQELDSDLITEEELYGHYHESDLKKAGIN